MSNNFIAIALKGDVLVVDSRLVAERLGILHKNFLATIYRYQSEIEQEEGFGSIAFETESKISGGRINPKPGKFAWLTEPQLSFLMTLSRNTPQVVQCKRLLVKAFVLAKEQLSNANEGQNLLGRAVSEFVEDMVAPKPLLPKASALTVVMLGSEYMTIDGFFSCFDKGFSALEYTTLFHEMMVYCFERGIEIPTISTAQKIEHLFPIEVLTQHHK